jgi:starch synthase
MNVLFVSAEMAPFAKVGGLADVIGSLPKSLRGLGVDARIILPCYRFIDLGRIGALPLLSFQLPRPTGTTDVSLFQAEYDGVPVYFLRGWPYFGEETAVYSEWEWDVPRFIFFCQAVVAAADALRDHISWFPDVVHVNDWHTGLVPFLIALRRVEGSGWARVGTLVGIHNLAYQGEHVGGWLWELGVPGRHHPELTSRGLTDNLLAIAIAYSDIVTTVSPRYAIEIQYPYMGYGLEGLIRARLDDLYGILNGIDDELWNPRTDPHLVANFGVEDFRAIRPLNKDALQREMGLEPRPDVPLIGMVTRLVWQKGIDLALPAMRRLLAGHDVQFVALGAGEQQYNEALWRLGADFAWKARANIGYNAAVAQHIYAGCDLFLMPSHYEPCGVGQMLAMRYGALPLVRETGGLADTVTNYDNAEAETGTGFVFQWEEADAVYHTLLWAIDVYRQRPAAWQRMQERAMRLDFSWRRSAREYMRLYEKAALKQRLPER